MRRGDGWDGVGARWRWWWGVGGCFLPSTTPVMRSGRLGREGRRLAVRIFRISFFDRRAFRMRVDALFGRLVDLPSLCAFPHWQRPDGWGGQGGAGGDAVALSPLWRLSEYLTPTAGETPHCALSRNASPRIALILSHRVYFATAKFTLTLDS